MKPLWVLLTVFALALIATKLISGDFLFALSGRVAMSAMLVFTAIGHFAFPAGMAMMLPDFIPFRRKLVLLTGIIELGAAVGIQLESWRNLTGWLLIVFFLLVLPANIYAAVKKVDYQKANHDGPGVSYLYFRIPLQVLFILWTYFSVIR